MFRRITDFELYGMYVYIIIFILRLNNNVEYIYNYIFMKFNMWEIIY